MNILDKAVRGFRDWTAARWPKMGPAGGGSAPSTMLHLGAIGRPAEEVVPVYAALRARTEAISQVPLLVGDGEENLIESGDLYELLSHPNQWMDQVQYLAAVESYLTLYDECYVAMVGEGSARPDELIPLHPQYMRPVWGMHVPTGMRAVMGWIYNDPHTGGQSLWDWTNVIPIFGFNPHAPFKGLSPSAVGKRTMQQDLATRESNLALFVNGGMPDVVLETDQSLTPDQAKEFMERWEGRYGGFAKAHKAGILANGLKAKVLGLNPEELQAFEALRMTTREVCMIFRVMPAMMHIMEGETGLSQGSSTESQKVAWWANTGLSELSRIASAHQRFLVDRSDWGGGAGRAMRLGERDGRRRQGRRMRAVAGISGGRKTQVWFAENQIPELAEHNLKRVDVFAKICERGYPPDEVNEYLDLGLPPHPTNIGTVPFSVQAVSDVGAIVPEPAPPKPVTTEVTESTEEIGRIFERLERQLAGSADRAKASQFKGLAGAVRALRTPMEKAAARKYSRFFTEQRKRVLDRISARGSGVAGRGEERAGAEDLLRSIFPKGTENQELEKLIQPLIVQNMKDAWEKVTPDVKADPKKNPFEVNDPRIKDAIDRRLIQGTKINDTTEDDLRTILSTGFDEGLSTAQLGDRIAEYYAEHMGEGKVRPQTAAMTQTTGIINDARMERAKAVGGLRKGWLHGNPNEAREDHLAAEAKYLAEPIPVNEKFVVGGFDMDAPGDANAPIEQTANCTCMVVFVPENGAAS